MGIKQLLEWSDLSKNPNIVDKIDDDRLIKIGEDVVSRANDDDASRHEWKERSKDAMELALQVMEEKSFPWPNASNIKYPIVTVAALQFHARVMPAILSGNKIAKAKVTGRDPNGEKEESAFRVAEYMNYQLIEEMEDWEDDMDRLLLALSIEGCEFKKTYFSPDLGTNVSEWIRPEDLIVHNKTKKLSTCPRITHRIFLHPQEITERMNGDLWSEVDLGLTDDDKDAETLQEFYEQHCLIDLDDDDYKEPYCVTVHKESRKVVRVKANYYPEDIEVKVNGEKVTADQLFEGEKATLVKISRAEYFTKYSFIPSPDGGFYDIGIGHIVGPLNHAISDIINQMVDAGTLANTQGGFLLDGVSVGNKRGPIKWLMGEWKKIKAPHNLPINHAVMPFDFQGPSLVLFNLLGLLIQSAKDITGVQDIHTGSVERKETATTTMARIEEGQKVFNATFKRVYRGVTQELRKLYRLNSIYLQPETYFRVIDSNEEAVVSLSDFRNDGTDIQPVADPTMANTAQRIAKAEALYAQIENPHLNGQEVTMRYLEAIEVTNPENLMAQGESPEVMQVKEQAQMMIDQMQQGMEQLQVQLQDATLKANSEEQKYQIDAMKMQNEAAKLQLEEAKVQIDQFEAQTDRMEAEGKLAIDRARVELDSREPVETSESPEPEKTEEKTESIIDSMATLVNGLAQTQQDTLKALFESQKEPEACSPKSVELKHGKDGRLSSVGIDRGDGVEWIKIKRVN